MNKNPYVPIEYRILEVIQETERDYTFRLRCRSSIRVKDGQFFQVSLPGIGECPIGMSDIGKDWMELTIRNVGKVTNEICQLKKNDILYLRGPFGTHWPFEEKFQNKHLIIAAGGTGVSPVRSMVNKILYSPNSVKKIELFLGFKNPYNILYKNNIEKWRQKFKVFVTVDDTCGIWDGQCSGLITQHISKAEIDDIQDVEVVVVGPPAMMKFTIMEFLKFGIPDEQIWVSYERRMSCGIGKCGHCKIDDLYVCLDGPVLNFSQTKNLFD